MTAAISFINIELHFNSYIIPLLAGLNVLNNLTLVTFLLFNRTLRRSLPRTVHLIYIAMAVNDINNSIYMQITHFLGMIIDVIQGYHFNSYGCYYVWIIGYDA